MDNTVRARLITRVMAALFLLVFISTVAFSIIGITFASEAHSAEHILTYETGSLTWNDGATGIGEDGSYSINLFDTLPVGEDGMKIIAPGANSGGSITLNNTTSRLLTYTAAVYLISDAGVPITADFTNFDPSNTVDGYVLPSGVEGGKILRVVSGEVDRYGSSVFDVSWEWAFSTGAEGDIYDTALGNLEFSELSIGVIITVEDNEAQDGVTAPDPSTCTCMICLFGGGCAMCWLCWTMFLIVIFVGSLCAVSMVISLAYGLWWIALIAISLLAIVGAAIGLIILFV